MNSLLLDLLTFSSVLSAILVITARSPVIAVIFLIAVFINLAGYLILLGINFIGLAYIMVYIGAIAILFLFVLMMMNIRLTEINQIGTQYSKNIPLAIVIASALNYIISINYTSSSFDRVYLITALFDKINFWLAGVDSSSNVVNTAFSTVYSNIFINYGEVQVLGAMLYSSHGLYLILVSFILLLAMIGPIILTLDKKSSNTPQGILTNNTNLVGISLNKILLVSILFFIIIGLSIEFSEITLLVQTNEVLLSVFVPIMIYSNPDEDKLKILEDNKSFAGIYQWTHKESGKRYLGSAVQLNRRIAQYFSIGYLSKNKNMRICNALAYHGYSAFSLTIFERLSIDHLSKDEARVLILSYEQFYIDTLSPEYNLNLIAGSRLGTRHSEETKALMKTIKMGENNPMFGKTRVFSAETKNLLSLAMKGDKHHRSMLGRTHSEETKNKFSMDRGTTIYVYSSDGSTLINSFTSATKAAIFFNTGHSVILSHARNGKLFKNEWILSLKALA